MKAARAVGRTIGVLVLAHLATGLTVPYILMQPLTVPPAGFLSTAAGVAAQVRWSVALLFVGGVATVAIAVAAWPILRERSQASGQWLFALSVVNLALQVVENQHWLSMLFLSQEYTRAAPADGALLLAFAPIVRSGWKWAHYTHLLVAVGWMVLFCAILFRLALVPRALAATGLAAGLLQIGGITLPVLLDYSVPFRMEVYGMPLGVLYLALAVWLMAKGFVERPDRRPDGAHGG